MTRSLMMFWVGVKSQQNQKLYSLFNKSLNFLDTPCTSHGSPLANLRQPILANAAQNIHYRKVTFCRIIVSKKNDVLHHAPK